MTITGKKWLAALLMCFTILPPVALAEDDAVLTPFFWGKGNEEANEPIKLGQEFDLSLGFKVNGEYAYYEIGEITGISLKKANENNYILLYKNGQTYSHGAPDEFEGPHYLLHLCLADFMDPGEYVVVVTAEKGTFTSVTTQTFLPADPVTPGGPNTPGQYGFDVEAFFFLNDDFGETVTEIPIGQNFAVSLSVSVDLADVQVVELFSEGETFREYVLYEDGQVNYGGKINDPEEGVGFMTGFSSASFEPGEYYLKVVTKTDADGTHEPAITFTGTGSGKTGPAFTAVNPPAGKEGEAYSYTFAATPKYGGAITWSVTSGALPTAQTAPDGRSCRGMGEPPFCVALCVLGVAIFDLCFGLCVVSLSDGRA